MRLSFVVDRDAVALSAELNAIMRQEELEGEFRPLCSIEQMFRELQKSKPDLILLHQNWAGLTITQILQEIANKHSEIRVIIFTGQEVRITELVGCVRFGVADYWTKEGLDPRVVVRKISYYCESPSWTMERLRMSSGSVQQLVEQAERSIQKLESVVGEKEELRSRLDAMESVEGTETRRSVTTLAKVGGYSFVLTTCLIVDKNFTNFGTFESIAFVIVIALFSLFVEGKISAALPRWKDGSAEVKGGS